MNPKLKNIIRSRHYKGFFRLSFYVILEFVELGWLTNFVALWHYLLMGGFFLVFFTLLAISIFLKHLLKNLYFIKLSPSGWAQSSFPLFLSVSGHPDGGCALFKRKKEKCCWDWKHFNFYSMNRSRIMTSSQNACQILYL